MPQYKCCDIPDLVPEYCEVDWSRIFVKYTGNKPTKTNWWQLETIDPLYEGRYSNDQYRIEVNYMLEASGLVCDDQALLITTLWNLVVNYCEFTCNMGYCMDQQHPIIDELINESYPKLSLGDFGEVDMADALFHLCGYDYQLFAYDYVLNIVEDAMYNLKEEGKAQFLDFEVTVVE